MRPALFIILAIATTALLAHLLLGLAAPGLPPSLFKTDLERQP